MESVIQRLRCLDTDGEEQAIVLYAQLPEGYRTVEVTTPEGVAAYAALTLDGDNPKASKLQVQFPGEEVIYYLLTEVPEATE